MVESSHQKCSLSLPMPSGGLKCKQQLLTHPLVRGFTENHMTGDASSFCTYAPTYQYESLVQ